MNDAELLAGLLNLFDFESRREAEHVVRCRTCEMFGDDPYRCPANPAMRRAVLTQWVTRRRAKVVWALRGFPGRSKTDDVMYQTSKQLEEQIVADLQRSVWALS